MPVNLIVLAAGQGTRMQSDLPKVMHEIGGAPLFAHALAQVFRTQPPFGIRTAPPGTRSRAGRIDQHAIHLALKCRMVRAGNQDLDIANTRTPDALMNGCKAVPV